MVYWVVQECCINSHRVTTLRSSIKQLTFLCSLMKPWKWITSLEVHVYGEALAETADMWRVSVGIRIRTRKTYLCLRPAIHMDFSSCYSHLPEIHDDDYVKNNYLQVMNSLIDRQARWAVFKMLIDFEAISESKTIKWFN